MKVVNNTIGDVTLVCMGASKPYNLDIISVRAGQTAEIADNMSVYPEYGEIIDVKYYGPELAELTEKERVDEWVY